MTDFPKRGKSKKAGKFGVAALHGIAPLLNWEIAICAEPAFAQGYGGQESRLRMWYRAAASCNHRCFVLPNISI